MTSSSPRFVAAMIKYKLANPEGAEGAEKLFTLFWTWLSSSLS